MPDLNETQFNKLLDAMTATASAATASIEAISRTQTNINAIALSIADIKTDIALLRQVQQTHSQEQTEMRMLMIGTRNDGIIFQDRDRITALEKKNAAEFKRHSERLDASIKDGNQKDFKVTVLNAIFSLLSSAMMVKWGVPIANKVSELFHTGVLTAWIARIFNV